MIAPFALSIHICAPQKLLNCAAMLSCRSSEMLLILFLFPQGYINSTAAKTNEAEFAWIYYCSWISSSAGLSVGPKDS